MTEPQVWLITGAGRGLGVDIAKAALDAGHEVVATARRAEAVTRALGEHDALLPVALDVTDPRGRRRKPSRRPSTSSDGSTCSSTTPAASTPVSSRR